MKKVTRRDFLKTHSTAAMTLTGATVSAPLNASNSTPAKASAKTAFSAGVIGHVDLKKYIKRYNLDGAN